MKRCAWCGDDPLYVQYHDEEWGKPVHDDRVHFEFLVLESAQAGLSWITILRKREAYREAFAQFDPVRVAGFTQDDVERLMENAGIVRNRRKIEAAITNAQIFLDIQKEYGSFDAYLWGHTKGEVILGKYQTVDELPAQTELSVKISKDLKKRGMKFLGPVIMYSHLQAVGLVNDHIEGCDFRFRGG